MDLHNRDQNRFDLAVTRSFVFLETEYGFHMTSSSFVNEGPRDSYYLAKYRKIELRVDIAWAPVELGLGVLMRVEIENLGRKDRLIYVEPFIEFLTDGQIVPVIPQIYPAMSDTRIKKIMEERSTLFENGYDEPMDRVALRLKEYYHPICIADCDTIRRYHKWYFRGRG